jgi:hypothetical protein
MLRTAEGQVTSHRWRFQDNKMVYSTMVIWWCACWKGLSCCSCLSHLNCKFKAIGNSCSSLAESFQKHLNLNASHLLPLCNSQTDKPELASTPWLNHRRSCTLPYFNASS